MNTISRREWLAAVAGGSVLAGALAADTRLRAQESRPANGSILDIHQHVATTDNRYSELSSVDERIRQDYQARTRIMDANGIDRSVLMVSTQYRRTDGIKNTMQINDLVAEYVTRHSDRFPVGVGTVEVTHGDASLKELERMSKDLRLRGVVWHHTHSGVQVDDPFMGPILKQVEALGLVPFVHVGLKPYESLDKLETLLEAFPRVTFVALAALARSEDAEQALQVGKRRRNVLFDTGPVIYTRERGVESLVKQLGSGRLLFGSDLYADRPSYRRATTTLDVINNSLIPDGDKANILGLNARKLFQLPLTDESRR